MAISVFSLIVGFNQSVYAQGTTITGKLPGVSGYEIRLTAIADEISQRKIVLDKYLPDTSNKFELQSNYQTTRQLFIETGFYYLPVFAEPGIQYALFCDSIKLEGEYRPLYNRDILNCSTESTSGLNDKINAFNQLYNQFILNEFGGIYQRRNLNVIRNFKARTDSLFGIPENDFFGIYRKYKIAGLELTIAPTKKNTWFRKYIDHQEIKYHNPEFMYFFRQFFAHHLTNNNRFIQRYEIRDLINHHADYPVLMDSIGKDTLLRNEKVRELALLIALKELYHEPDFSQKNILDDLLFARSYSKFEEHREIAANLYFELTKLENGFAAPEFTLPTLDHDTMTLSDFRGKPLYIGFMNTLSFASLAEFSLMDSLYQQFGSRIQFITISMDDNPEIIDRFRKEKGYDWTFLYNGMHFGLVDAYELKTLPLFIFIDGKGNILQYPARKPSEGISEAMQRILQK